ncbi:MAG: hypothetical protein ABJK11_06135 [Balneola sp.]
MKFIRYTLLILLCAFLLNLITFLIFGEKVLRERNLSEFKKEKIGSVFKVNPTYSLISNLNTGESNFEFKNRQYPIFKLSNFVENDNDFEVFADSVINWQRFTLPVNNVNNLLGTNLDSLEALRMFHDVDSLLDRYYRDIVFFASDSLSNLTIENDFNGYCNLYDNISCDVYEGWVIILAEEVYFHSLFFADQKILLGYWGEHYETDRVEKLIWLFDR